MLEKLQAMMFLLFLNCFMNLDVQNRKKTDVKSFRKLVKKYITNFDKKIILAQLCDAEIIVMISIIFLSRLNQNSLELYIPELIVREEFPNQGMGKKIIDSCISITEEKKYHRIRLESGN